MIASASITFGIFGVSSINRFTAARDDSSSPIPGPITRACTPLPVEHLAIILSTFEIISSSSICSGINSLGHFALAAAFFGIATCTRSQPILAAAMPASNGAP
ncbi:MAG: hypothetical protein CMA91_05135 [Euryarchaeota archaeon]|nr:hypothetical protein [Euryarchaeota archaeon]